MRHSWRMAVRLRAHRYRWWYVPGAIACGAFFGLGLRVSGSVGRFAAQPRSWPDSAELLSSIGVGAVLGALSGLLIVLGYALRDSGVLAVRRAHPNAVVFHARWELTGPPATRQRAWFPVAFDDVGMRIYSEAVAPGEVALIDWSQISEVSVGEPFVSKSRYSYSHDCLAVSVVRDGEILTMQLGVQLGARPFATAREIAQLAQRIDDVRDGILRVDSRPSPPLVAGITAFNASHIATLVAALAALFAVALGGLALLLDATVSRGAAWLAVSAISLPMIAAAVAHAIARRASRNERRAGYTTRNGVYLDLAQRHPGTGEVIRRAGSPAIDQRDFVQMLMSGSSRN